MRVLLIAAALFVATPAFAQSGGSSATLAAPAQTRTIIDGATWSCEGTACTTSGGTASQPAARACRRVVARIGKVSAFTWRGTALSAEQLATCNA